MAGDDPWGDDAAEETTTPVVAVCRYKLAYKYKCYSINSI